MLLLPRPALPAICFRSGPLGGDLTRGLQPFAALGDFGEGASQYGMVALESSRWRPSPRLPRRYAEGLKTVLGTTRKAGSVSPTAVGEDFGDLVVQGGVKGEVGGLARAPAFRPGGGLPRVGSVGVRTGAS